MEPVGFAALLAIGFIASIIATFMGMGMLIIPPSMILFGIPVHTAVATSRFSILGLNIGNVSRFSSKGRLKFRYAIPFASAAVFGTLIGASFMSRIDERLLKAVIGCFMIAVSLLIAFEKKLISRKHGGHITLKQDIVSFILGFFVGSYLGIIGGGGATIIILLLSLIYGLGIHDAIASQKAITICTTVISTSVFIYQGLIDYKLGIPLLLANLFGGWVGAGLLFKFKANWLKSVIIPVVMAMGMWLIFT
jgi:uncharacterized protein